MHWPRLMYQHRHLRSANNNLLFVPKTHLHYGDITFTVSAAKMWNQLPTVIKLSGSVNIFKKKSKNPFIYPSSWPKLVHMLTHWLPVCVLCLCIYNHCFVMSIAIMYVIFEFSCS